MSRPITPEDLENLARVGQLEPLPDGTAGTLRAPGLRDCAVVG